MDDSRSLACSMVWKLRPGIYEFRTMCREFFPNEPKPIIEGAIDLLEDSGTVKDKTIVVQQRLHGKRKLIKESVRLIKVLRPRL